MLKTHLTDIKHQGEPKLWHSEPLDHGKGFSMPQSTERTAGPTSPCPMSLWSCCSAPPGLRHLGPCQAPAMHANAGSMSIQDPHPTPPSPARSQLHRGPPDHHSAGPCQAPDPHGTAGFLPCWEPCTSVPARPNSACRLAR
jgi:hypothetical protein